MKPTFDLPRLCRDLLLIAEDLATPAVLAQQSRLAEALKAFAADAIPVLREALTHGLSAAAARRILIGMANVHRLSNGKLVQTSNERIKGFFVLKYELAEALEYNQIPATTKPTEAPCKTA